MAWGEARIESPLLGRFNVSNLLGVLGVLLVRGVALADAAQTLQTLRPVAGRMQTVDINALLLDVTRRFPEPSGVGKNDCQPAEIQMQL